MNQPTLFASEPFTHLAARQGHNARQRVIDQTLAKAQEEWRERYSVFILDYLRDHGPSTAEQIRLAHEEAGLPGPTKSKRASGGIYQQLQEAGRIEVVEMNISKLYGNPVRRYRRVR